MDNLKYIIESLLFVADTPLTINRIGRVVPTVDKDAIKDAIATLSREYDARAGGFYLREVAGGFQLCTRPEYNQWIKRFIQPKAPRLSRAALETLATIAYKQPIIRSDIEYIRGVDCGGVLRNLLERNLIRVMGRKEIPGRPLIYGTTKQFLMVFDLKDLKDLPTPEEIESLSAGSEDQDQLFKSLPKNGETEPASPRSPAEQPPDAIDDAPATDPDQVAESGVTTPQDNGSVASQHPDPGAQDTESSHKPLVSNQGHDSEAVPENEADQQPPT